MPGSPAAPGPATAPRSPSTSTAPETSLYRKGHLLFGLQQARDALAAGATPVIVEGPFDAIAVTTAADGRHAGLAPCGTALTAGQAALLGQACDLARAGALVAFDPDPAGLKAAIRAYGILRPLTATLRSVQPGGSDPAQILQDQGAKALRDILTSRTEPLLGVIADAEINRMEYQLGDAEGPFRAMRAAAVALARLLPADVAAQIRQITTGAELSAVDEQMRPAVIPQLPGIARILPADTAREVTRLADRLGFTSSDVLIEVANAVTRQASRPRREAAGRSAVSSFPNSPTESLPSEQVDDPQRTAQLSRRLAAGDRSRRAVSRVTRPSL